MDWTAVNAGWQKRAKPKHSVNVDICTSVPPVPEEVCDASNFKRLWARKWKYSNEHINVKEGRVALSSLRRAVRVQNFQTAKRSLLQTTWIV